MTTPRLVLAEDHDAVAAQLQALLEEEFDVIEVVRDGQALIAAVEAHSPDAVVSDIAMPLVSGLEAARVILGRRPGLPVVFVTVRDEAPVIREAMATGAGGYVIKCDAGEELLPAVQSVLGGSRYVSTNARVAMSARTRTQERGEQ